MPEVYPAYFGGEFRLATSGELLDAANPATGEGIGRFPRCGAADVEIAVVAAREAFRSWRELHPRQRAACILDLADRIEQDRDRLLLLDVRDNGSPIREMAIDIDVGVMQLRYFAGLAHELRGDTMQTGHDRLNYTLRQPFGVCAQLLPFNHPLMFSLKTIGAPLIAGNTVIVKPSEQTSLSTLAIGEHLKAAFPPAVVSVLSGLGSEAGDALVTHPDIRRIHFIGGDTTGRMIQARAASAGVKSVTLELGGKNPLLICPDADIDAALDGAMRGMRFNFQGQACGSTSRLMLPRELKDDFLARLAERISALKSGLPEDPATDIGAIVSEQQMNRVLGYIQAGRDSGGRILAGGGRITGQPFANGYFIRPTLITDMEPDCRLLHEEVFGPVLAAVGYDDLDGAIRAINQSPYGLTASIYTGDLAVAHRFARDVEAGYVWVNDNQTHFIGTPYGGNKNSGLGREEDATELASYTEIKNVNIRFG